MMRFLVIVTASKESEAGVLPSQELLPRGVGDPLRSTGTYISTMIHLLPDLAPAALLLLGVSR
jgi:hypothetical protein